MYTGIGRESSSRLLFIMTQEARSSAKCVDGELDLQRKVRIVKLSFRRAETE